MLAHWSNIANSVKSIQPILRPTVLPQDHTADENRLSPQPWESGWDVRNFNTVCNGCLLEIKFIPAMPRSTKFVPVFSGSVN